MCFRLVVSGHLQKEADFFSNFIEGERGIKEFCNQVTNTTSFRLNVYCLSYPLKLDRVYTLDCLDMKVHTLVIDEIRWWKINTRAFHKNVWPLMCGRLTDTDFKGHLPYQWILSLVHLCRTKVLNQKCTIPKITSCLWIRLCISFNYWDGMGGCKSSRIKDG